MIRGIFRGVDGKKADEEVKKAVVTFVKDLKPPATYCIAVYDPAGLSDDKILSLLNREKDRSSNSVTSTRMSADMLTTVSNRLSSITIIDRCAHVCRHSRKRRAI